MPEMANSRSRGNYTGAELSFFFNDFKRKRGNLLMRPRAKLGRSRERAASYSKLIGTSFARLMSNGSFGINEPTSIEITIANKVSILYELAAQQRPSP